MRRIPFDKLRAEIDHDPERRARVDEMKQAMHDAVRLAELRASQEVSQQEVAARMGVSQARVSQIERGKNLYLSTLENYVAALGGELRVEAVFGSETVVLTDGPGDRESTDS